MPQSLCIIVFLSGLHVRLCGPALYDTELSIVRDRRCLRDLQLVPVVTGEVLGTYGIVPGPHHRAVLVSVREPTVRLDPKFYVTSTFTVVSVRPHSVGPARAESTIRLCPKNFDRSSGRGWSLFLAYRRRF